MGTEVVSEFRRSPVGMHRGALLALWWDGQGDWEQAHEVAQEIEDNDGAWVHAYLHRKQGDASNAGYWYRRAGQPVATGSLEAEWEQMVAAILQRV